MVFLVWRRTEEAEEEEPEEAAEEEEPKEAEEGPAI